ncbi:hypothetical protein LIER_38393 [Lithospermum erythrorhizon]|uniref:Programmed cell death protein 4-like n=1 Tax=Lithospermum erythrorhizon TaxID=34254 RepID=A0AAV3Q0K4_LITER
MKQSDKGSKPIGKQEVKRDRKSGTGFNGSPKKGGRGGKFTWSGDGYSQGELGTCEKEAIDNDTIARTNVNINNA